MHHFTPTARQMPTTSLTRLDARVKLLCALALLVMVISCRGIAFPLLVAALCLAALPRHGSAAAGAGDPLCRAAAHRGDGAAPQAVLQRARARSFPSTSSGWRSSATGTACMEGLLIASRIAGAVSLVALARLFHAVHRADGGTGLAQGAARVHRRGAVRLALPVRPVRRRPGGLQPPRRTGSAMPGYRRGLRSFGTLAGALVIKAFDNSQTITTAMVQRGYDGTMPLLKHKPFRIGGSVGIAQHSSSAWD